MFRIENGWILSMYDELEVWISNMFSFDLENSWGIRRYNYDIWNPYCNTVRLMYIFWISGKFSVSSAVRLVGEDDRSLAPTSLQLVRVLLICFPRMRLRVCSIGYASFDSLTCVFDLVIRLMTRLMKHIVSFSWRGCWVCRLCVLIIGSNCFDLPCLMLTADVCADVD